MGAYLTGVVRAVFGHGLAFWGSLFFTWLLGLGAFAEYPEARERFAQWLRVPVSLMPTSISLLLFIFLFWSGCALASFTRRRCGICIPYG